MFVSPILTQIAPTQAQISRHHNIRKQAETFVAQTFFQPLFKQMRTSPFKSDLFSGGRGGEVYQSMMDSVLTTRMGKAGAGKQLVDAITEKLDPLTFRKLKMLDRIKARQGVTGEVVDTQG